MGPVEYLIYTILFIVFIGLIGIIGYFIYDNFQKNEEYKKSLTKDLNTNFVDINKNFDSTTTNMDKIYKSNSKKINLLDERLEYSSNLFASNFSDVRYNIAGNSNLFASNFADVRYNIIGNSNLFATSNVVVNRNFDTFNTNLNKYFVFNDNAALATSRTPFNNMNNKLFEYVTSGEHIPMLDLIRKTTATAGLKINTDSTNADNDLEICNKDGNNCFNISSDNVSDTLYIYKKGTVRANAPFKIVNGVVDTSGGGGGGGGGGGTQPSQNAGKISTSPTTLTTEISFTTTGAGYIGHNATPTLTISGIGGNGLAIGNFQYNSTGGITNATITNSGSGYTANPTVTAGLTPPPKNPVKFYTTNAATATATFVVSTVPQTGAIANSLPFTNADNGYYESATKLDGIVRTSIVTITNNPVRATATAVTNAQGVVISITITNDTDNGFYYKGATPSDPTNATIVSIGGINLAGKTFTYDKIIENGIWKSISNILGAGNTGFTSSSSSLEVVLSEPLQPSADTAIITPVLQGQKGSITSLTLTYAGSKYYKPSISVADSNLVNPVAATMPTLYRLS